MKVSRKYVAAAAVVVASVVLGATAYGFWTTSGTGTGSAVTATSTAVTVAQLGATTGLYPGGPAVPVNFTINNPGPSAQYISTVAVTMTGVTGANVGVLGPCTVGDFVLTQPAAINADLAVGATNFAPSGSTISLTNAATNQDGCKSATVALAFAAS